MTDAQIMSLWNDFALKMPKAHSAWLQFNINYKNGIGNLDDDPTQTAIPMYVLEYVNFNVIGLDKLGSLSDVVFDMVRFYYRNLNNELYWELPNV